MKFAPVTVKLYEAGIISLDTLAPPRPKYYMGHPPVFPARVLLPYHRSKPQ
jgi:hypothetical protein